MPGAGSALRGWLRRARQTPGAGPPCPCPGGACGGPLTKRRSRRGIFYGCSNYPKCAFTMNQPPQERACPQCQHPWLMKKGKKILCTRDECSFEATAAAGEGRFWVFGKKNHLHYVHYC